ncbi:acyltransferase [Vibrio cholerae]|uniref:acyltransferase n=1 Tax=Vibrio cholerae TaxID=666 RepID=UPI00206E8904|nr:acyltransferase [Vibrio cholerae]MCU4202727.1 acyltransferase [Vibrio cholerae]MCU4204658.1 acyltransferase [Vibrio cholerae]BCN18458.1 putative acetyltransferase [Vibrio cholerae]GHX80311.1 Putative acetyltransferase YvoF [Vibrio cholerae]
MEKLKRVVIMHRMYYFLLAIKGIILRLRLHLRGAIGWSVRVIGISNVSIGANSIVGAGSLFNVNVRDGRVRLKIERNVYVGTNNFISVGDSVTLKEFSMSSDGCRLICSSHSSEHPMSPIIGNPASCGDSIVIGVNTFLGAGSTVIGNVVIGHGSIVGASSFVNFDVPPFSVVVGNPGRVVKRYCFDDKKWTTNVEGIDEGLVPDETSYLQLLKESGSPLIMPHILKNSILNSI